MERCGHDLGLKLTEYRLSVVDRNPQGSLLPEDKVVKGLSCVSGQSPSYGALAMIHCRLHDPCLLTASCHGRGSVGPKRPFRRSQNQ